MNYSIPGILQLYKDEHMKIRTLPAYFVILVSLAVIIRVFHVNDYRHHHQKKKKKKKKFHQKVSGSRDTLSSTAHGRVILFVLDGARKDMLYDKSICPNMVRLWEKSGIRYTGMTTQLPSVSAPNYYSLYSGAPPWLHGVTNNNRRGPYYQQGETLFHLCRMAKRGSLTIGFEWYKQMFGLQSRYIPAECCEQVDSSEIIRLLSAEIRGRQLPAFTAVHFLAPDSAGHATGSSESRRYVQSISRIDSLFGRVYSLLKEQYPGIRVMITSDHGMNIDGNHGGSDPLSLEVPLYVYGAGHSRAEESRPLSSLSLAPTISAMLGIHVPHLSAGTLLPQVLMQNQYDLYLQRSIQQKEQLLAALTGNDTRSMVLLEDEKMTLKRHEENLSKSILQYFPDQRDKILLPQRMAAIILLVLLVLMLAWDTSIPSSFLVLNGILMGLVTAGSMFIISKHLYTIAVSTYLLITALSFFLFFRYYFPVAEFVPRKNGHFTATLVWLMVAATALLLSVLPVITTAPHPDIFMVRLLTLLLLHPFLATAILFTVHSSPFTSHSL